MIELAIKTITADSRIGSQSAARNCIGGLFPSNKMDKLRARLSCSPEAVKRGDSFDSSLGSESHGCQF
jgi:hypothetical protein